LGDIVLDPGFQNLGAPGVSQVGAKQDIGHLGEGVLMSGHKFEGLFEGGVGGFGVAEFLEGEAQAVVRLTVARFFLERFFILDGGVLIESFRIEVVTPGEEALFGEPGISATGVQDA